MNKKTITLILIFFSFLCILSGCKIGGDKNPTKDPDKTDLQIKQEEIYKLAKESGFSGTYEEWLETIKGIDGTSITKVEINTKGELIITLSTGKIHNLGVIKGTDGKDGIGIKDININSKGELVITYTDGTTDNLGVVKGQDGTSGTDGKDGVSITEVKISLKGELVISLSNGTTKNLGSIKGSNGLNGKDGIGVEKVEINSKGELVITYTDNTSKNLGLVKGTDGKGVKEIKLTSTVDLVDTYTIYYTDGTTSTFKVTNGKDGAQGIQGIQGVPGKDGHSPVITIVEGYWYVDGVNTNQVAQGLQGETGNGISNIVFEKSEELVDTYKIIFTNGTFTTFTVTNGKDGAQGEQGIQGIQGEKGEDGHTPVITIQDGYWYIDGVNTLQTAQGLKGDTGNGISSIKLTSTVGLVDTYTITYTNGETFTFTVTNGKDGAQGEQGIQGIQGEKGEDGHTPVITIQDGYWYIDGVNTLQAAQGLKGDTGNGISSIKLTSTVGLVDTYTITYTDGTTSTFTVTNGAQGEQGIQGIQGVPGKDGHTPVITIQNGNWYIDGVDTLVRAEAKDGVGISKIEKTSSVDLVDTYTIYYTNGETSTFTVTNGKDGIQGIQGEKGEDGHTPVITIQEGYWYIDGVNTNQAAQGLKGDTGNGISSIKLTSTVGLVDTYTITYTNGETSTFTVTNGKDGAQGEQGIQGIQGVPGKDGHTPVITIQDGYWYIDGVNTNQAAQGLKGDTGNGISDISYTRTEGLVDIYTITYTNGETSEFNVTNGKDGVGIQDVTVDEEGYLIITLTDGTSKRLGQVLYPDKDEGVVPVYQGMTLESNEEVEAALLKAKKHYFDFKFNSKVKDYLDIISVETVQYNAEKGEKFNVVVHIYNPSSFEILSFTLNGYKYQSYEFKEGSNSTRLIVEVDAGQVSGVKEFTIDAIKYIDGTKIQDVQMDGEKTIKAGVKYEIVPTASIIHEEIGTTSYKAQVEIKDDMSLMDKDEGMHFFVYDGENIVAHKVLTLGINDIEITDLLMGIDYEFMVVGVYDDYSGKGKRPENLTGNKFKTLEGYLVDSLSSTHNEIILDIKQKDSKAVIQKIELFLDETLVTSSEFNEKVTFSNLLSNTEYTVKVTYTYDKNNVERTNYLIYNISTESKQAPNISINKLTSNKTNIEFGLEVSDIDNVKTNFIATLYQGLNKVLETNNLNELFENLYSNTEYKLVLTYYYDLNDNAGEQKVEIVETIKTKQLTAPTIDLTYVETSDNISYTTAVKDNDNTLEEVVYKLYKGSSLVESTTNVEYVFNQLLSNTEYKLVVSYTYNLNDNLESITEELTYNIVTLKQIPTINLSVSNITNTTVDVFASLNDPNTVGRIINISLYLNDALVKQNLTSTEVTFDNLTSNTNYKVVVNASYDLNDGNGSVSIEKEIEFTTIKTKPLVNLEVASNKKQVNFQVTYEDENEIFNLEKVEILKDNIVIEEKELLSGMFENLQSSTTYVVKLTYSYDLNDGLGEQTKTLTQNIRTKDLSVPTVGMNVISVSDTLITSKIVTSDADNILTIKELQIYKANNLFMIYSQDELSKMEEIVINAVSNTEYKYVISYEYDLNNGLGTQESTYEYSVISSKEMPVINLTSYFVTQNEMEYNLMISDPNASGRVNMISLYQGSSFIKRLDETTTKVDDLNSNTTYTIKVNYVYDFNDGLGSREINYTYNFTTLKQEPIFEINESNITKNSLEIEYDINDIDGALSLVKLELFLDEELIRTYNNLTDTLFEELLSNNEYKLVATFNKNINTGDETHTRVIYMTTQALEKPSVEITLDSSKTTIDYSYLINDPDKISTLQSIDLYYQGNKLDITSNNNQYSNLYTNSEYELVITLLNDYHDGKTAKEETYSKTVTTDSHVIPSLNLGLTSTAETINYQINLADPNNLIRVNKINVYNGLDLVKEVTDFTNLTIEELESNTLYTLEVEYEYNLNDNNGYIKQTYTKEYSTLAYNVKVVGYELINNLNPKTNEDINIKVILENESKVKMDYFIVNGEKLQIAGGDYYNNVIFYITAPKVSGEFTITVDKMGYFLNGVEVEQLVETEAEININIMSRLDIVNVSTLDGSAVAKNKYSSGIVFEIDNPYGYEILEYKISSVNIPNQYISVTMIDETHVYFEWKYADTMIPSFHVFGVKYIDENGEIAERKYEEQISIDVTILNGDQGTNALTVHQITTPEELINMQEGFAYELMNDIDLDGYAWEMKSFNGYFDGKGHKISNLRIVDENEYLDTTYVGIFTTIDGVFKNVYFENLYINVKTKGSINSNVLVGIGVPNNLSGVLVSGDIHFTSENEQNVSYPTGENVYIVDHLNYNDEKYSESNLISYDTFTSKEFIENTLGWVFPEKELGNYEGLLYTVIDNSYIIINGYEGENSEVIIPEAINDLPVVGVSDLAFENNETIKSITFNENILIIGSSILKGCSNLETLNIEEIDTIAPRNLAGLFGNVEYNNSYGVIVDGNYSYIPRKLKNIYINSESGTIFDMTDMTSLTKVTLGDKINRIGGGYFTNCTNLAEIIIPESVTIIEGNAFAYCNSLVEIDIPEGVEKIEEYTFNQCIALSSVSLPSTLISIGTSAFSNCYNLEKIGLPTGLKEIESGAFAACYNLEFIYIPDSVETIGSNAIVAKRIYCASSEKPEGWDDAWAGSVVYWGVEELFVDENFFYIIIDGKAIVIEYFNDEEEVTIPDNIVINNVNYPVVSIESHVFDNKKLHQITLSEHLTNIGDRAFYNCQNLKTIEIPGNVQKIGESAFEGCLGLVNIIINDGVETIGTKAFAADMYLNELILPGSLKEIDYMAFYDVSTEKLYFTGTVSDWCNIDFSKGTGWNNPIWNAEEVYFKNDQDEYELVVDIIIPNGVTKIGSHQFHNFGNRNIYISSSVTSIGEAAFGASMSNYYYVYIPESVISIGKDAFNHIVYCEASNKPSGWHHDWNSYENNTVYWEKEDFVIEKNALYLIENGEATLLKYIGEKAETIVIPSTVQMLDKQYTVVKIGSKAFGDNNLTNVVLPETIKYIDNYAFRSNNSLESINFPEGLIEIGDYAFASQLLTEIELPSTLKKIGVYAFQHNRFSEVVLPEGLEEIGDYAFANCSSIYEITIPSSVINMGENVFDHASGGIDKFIRINSSKKLVENGAYNIPEGWNKNWVHEQQKVYWSDDIIQHGYFLYTLDNENATAEVVGYVGVLNEITIPSTISIPFYYNSENSYQEYVYTVTSMRPHAFANSNLISVTIPGTITSIPSSAFDCTSLTSVILEEGVEILENASFNKNIYLTSINFPSTLTYIGENAFNDCTSLTRIELPEGLTTIMVGAFNNCSILEYVVIPSTVTNLTSGVFDLDNDRLVIYCDMLERPESWDEEWDRKSEGNYYKVIWQGQSYIETEEYDYVLDVENAYIAKYKGTNNKVIIPSLFTFEEIDYTVTKILKYAFYNNNNIIINLEIPNTITEIHKHAFDKSIVSSKLFIPLSVQVIGEKAFGSSSNLIYCEASSQPSGWYENWNYTSTVIWNIVKKGDLLFTLNHDLQEAEFAGYMGENTTLEIPESIKIGDNDYIVTSIKQDVLGFSKNTHIVEDLIIPGTITNMNEAFHYYEGLKSVTLEEGITEISSYAFYKVSTIEEINFPSSLVSIKNNAFEHAAHNMTELNLPDSLEEIGAYAFNYWQSLTSIDLKNVQSIGDKAFVGCSLIEELNIPSSLTTISDSAFANMYSLKEIYIPSTVISLGKHAFANASEEFVIYADVESRPEGWDKYFNLSDESDAYDRVYPVVWKNQEYAKTTEYIMTLDGNEAHIWKALINTENLVIPETIEYNNNIYTVTKLESDFLYGLGVINLTLPNTLTSINSVINSRIDNLYYNGTIEELLSIELLDETINPIIWCKNCYVLNENNEFEILTDIIIPESITVLTSKHLYEISCENLYLHKGITSYKAEYINATNVYYQGTLEDWFNNEFDSIAANPMYESENFYVLNENGEYELITELVIPESVTEIKPYQIVLNGSIQSLIIHKNVETIEAESIFVINGRTIYCEVNEKPETWEDLWSFGNSKYTVEYGYIKTE